MSRERIVLTGMGAVTPIGIGVADYWRRLLEGRSGVGPIRRFDPGELPVRVAAEVTDFEPADYMPKKLVGQTDLFMQFALAAAAEALAASGLQLGADAPAPDGAARTPAGAASPALESASAPAAAMPMPVRPERIGIVLGTALGGISTAAATQEQMTRSGSHRVTPHLVPKMLSNIGAAHIAIQHGLKGPSYTLNTACSSGADAVGMAAMLLKSGQADVVLAVGAESILSGLMAAGLASARALSTRSDEPERASRPFDRDRDGFVMGEGAGAVVLEREADARARGAAIQAELLGYANNSDAYHVTSPEPEGSGEVACMRAALAQAGLGPEAIDYVNAHGTSTPLGDAIETKALKAVFGERAYRLPVSSTKGATGHLMGAGGVTELIACVLAIRDGVVPPTLNYEHPDPLCDLDYVPNEARRAKVDVAMSNSFGFGGQNTSVIVGRYGAEAGTARQE